MMKAKTIGIVSIFILFNSACNDGSGPNNKCKDVDALIKEHKTFLDFGTALDLDGAKSSLAKITPLCDKIKKITDDFKCKVEGKDEKISDIPNLVASCDMSKVNPYIARKEKERLVPVGTAQQCKDLANYIREAGLKAELEAEQLQNILKEACAAAYKYNESQNYRCNELSENKKTFWITNEEVKNTCKKFGINP